ncbi:DUF3954 domain-containing protein [Bacillus mycoides]|uniref:DUF3954 domain-containing protein n=1 Tax=Bacillus mycoides TaxID=1405 RepID=A0A1W6A2M2_BACMY|nr:DUF3954 domain-containing protein [Bacillus mycoides]ARJ20084.1 DUF3954 domain-containing protein [Bacillus mycoides]
MLLSICARKEGRDFVKVEIDVTCNAIMIVKNGVVKQITPPVTGYGEQVVVWVGGKIDRVITTFTEKVK